MTSFRTAIAIAIGTLFAGSAMAQSNYEIEQRDRQQQARINQGIQSGELTRHETRELMEERTRIERMERRARADGTLSQHERNRIDNAQDRLGRHIYQETHDRQDRNQGWRGRDNGQHGWDRGNGNGWGRGNDNGNHYGWDRGHDRGNSNGHQQSDHRNGTNNGQRNESHSNSVTPRTGGEAHAGRADRTDRFSSRQASMPQAQARSTQTRETRTVVARQGGDNGRRTR